MDYGGTTYKELIFLEQMKKSLRKIFFFFFTLVIIGKSKFHILSKSIFFSIMNRCHNET